MRYGLRALTVVVVAWSVAHVVRDIDAPFVAGHHMTGHNALQGTANENYGQHGYLAMRFGVSGYRMADRCRKSFYINHPTLGVVIASLPSRLLGNDEWVIRGTQLLFYLLNLLLLFRVGRALLGVEHGLVAVMVYALLPVDRVYSVLPAYHGTMFLTYVLLIAWLTVLHARSGRPVHFVLLLGAYFLSLLHEWTSAVNVVAVLAYTLLFRRKHVYKDFFFVLLLTNLAIFMNFLHASLQVGRVAVDGPLGAFVPRAGGLEETLSRLPFLLYLFGLSFGAAALTAAAAGIYAFVRARDRLATVIVLGQAGACLLYILVFKGALYVHWYLFMIFSLLVTLLACYAAKHFGRHVAVALALVAVVAVESEATMSRYERDELNEGQRGHPIVESLAHFRRTYELTDRFLKARPVENDTLVLFRGPIFYLPDYYLGKAGYCFDVPGRDLRDYKGHPRFERAVYIDLDANGELVVEQVRPAPPEPTKTDPPPTESTPGQPAMGPSPPAQDGG